VMPPVPLAPPLPTWVVVSFEHARRREQLETSTSSKRDETLRIMGSCLKG
jgi:hypothetical protein